MEFYPVKIKPFTVAINVAHFEFYNSTNVAFNIKWFIYKIAYQKPRPESGSYMSLIRCCVSLVDLMVPMILVCVITIAVFVSYLKIFCLHVLPVNVSLFHSHLL